GCLLTVRAAGNGAGEVESLGAGRDVHGISRLLSPARAQPLRPANLVENQLPAARGTDPRLPAYPAPRSRHAAGHAATAMARAGSLRADEAHLQVAGRPIDSLHPQLARKCGR